MNNQLLHKSNRREPPNYEQVGVKHVQLFMTKVSYFGLLHSGSCVVVYKCKVAWARVYSPQEPLIGLPFVQRRQKLRENFQALEELVGRPFGQSMNLFVQITLRTPLWMIRFAALGREDISTEGVDIIYWVLFCKSSAGLADHGKSRACLRIRSCLKLGPSHQLTWNPPEGSVQRPAVRLHVVVEQQQQVVTRIWLSLMCRTPVSGSFLCLMTLRHSKLLRRK